MSLGFAAAAAQPPEAAISNGVIRARVYLPDAQNGYYRGTRFDWSGAISSLEYNGHTYFGQWFPAWRIVRPELGCGLPAITRCGGSLSGQSELRCARRRTWR